jgi:phosphopantetheine--protein transferase-like protein
VVEDYSAVKTFSDLIGGQDQSSANGGAAGGAGRGAGKSTEGSTGNIGIDIEAVSSLPVTNDFRRNEFYTMNFSSSEIAYCSLQPDPYASFAGLFCAKEAIIKAEVQHRSKSFNSICISHGTEGEPLYAGFHLSISHAGGVAVAVAVPARPEQAMPAALPVPLPTVKKGGKGALAISLLALVLAILAIIVAFIR